MKKGSATLALVVLVLGAAVAGATAGEQAKKPRTVTYLFEATFGLGLEVKWEENTGDKTGSCPTWTHRKGKLEVDARSVAAQGRAWRGTLEIYPTPRKTRLTGGEVNWANTSLSLGPARATVKAAFPVQEGRVCVDPVRGVSKPWKPPSNDCGERQYRSLVSSLTAEIRGAWGSLDEITGLKTGRSKWQVIVINVPPTPQAVFRACRLPLGLSPYPVQMAIWVAAGDTRALRALQPGDRHRIDTRGVDGVPWEEACGPEIIAEKCTFELDAFVEIRRFRKNER